MYVEELAVIDRGGDIYLSFFEVSDSLMMIYVYSFLILNWFLLSSLHVKHNFGLCIDADFYKFPDLSAEIHLEVKAFQFREK